MSNDSGALWRAIRIGVERGGYLIVAKALSLLLIAIMVYFLPSFFDTYARASIASALVASVLIVGFPYVMQLQSQDFKKPDLLLLSFTCLFFAISAFIALYGLGYGLITLLGVVIIGISPIIMGHVTEVFLSWQSNLIHFLLVVFSQPLIFLLVVIFPDMVLQSFDALFYICLVVWPVCLFYLKTRFYSYSKIFIIQSATVLIGSGIVSYVLADSVLHDKHLEAGFLWVLVQLSSVLIFLANSLSFRLIKYFSHSELRADIFRLGGRVYKSLAFAYIALIFIVATVPEYAQYVYCIYLSSQGISKVAGSAVLSLRRPAVPFYSALGSFIFVCVLLSAVKQEQVFSDGVLAVLVASLGGAATMFVILGRESRSRL